MITFEGIEYSDDELKEIVRKCKIILPYVLATIESSYCHYG